MTVDSQCTSCTHLKTGHPWRCDAFPKGDGIPNDVKLNILDHRRAVPGDNGVRWEAVDDMEHPLV